MSDNKMTEETHDRIKGIIEDAVRFGSAIGSWHDSKVPWHNHAGSDCIRAVKEHASREIDTLIKESENNYCHQCHQPKKVISEEPKK